MSSIAETAQLAVNLKLGTSGSFAGATGELGAVERAAVRGTGATGLLGRGFGVAKTAAANFGGALSHAKGQLVGLLTGPLGMLGLGAGLFSLAGLFKAGISQARDFGGEVKKLAALTGLSYETTSKLAGAFEHFGISAETATKIAGLFEKNLFALTDTTKLAGASSDQLTKAQERLRVAQLKLHEIEGKRNVSQSSLVAAQNRVADATRALAAVHAKEGTTVSNATAFYHKYGLALVDASGKAKDFNTLLLDAADFWNNKTIPAQTKAAALAKLYGRSWQDLIPILGAGRKGIAAAEEEAARLGLTITKDNIDALARAKEATRTWTDALGGLKLQIGLAVLTVLTDFTKGITSLVVGNRTRIVGFVKGVAQGAEDLAAAFGNFVLPALQSVASVVGTMFNSVGGISFSAILHDSANFAKDLGNALNSFVVPGVKAIVGAWDALPGPLRELLIKGFIANKVIKWTFGFDAAGFGLTLAKTFISNVAGKLTADVAGALAAVGIGKAFVQPVFVTNPGFGGGGGLPGVPAAAGAAEGAAAGIGAGTILVATLAIPAAILIANAIKAVTGVTDAQQQQAQTHGQFGPRSASNVPVGLTSLEDRDLRDIANFTAGTENNVGKMRDDVAGVAVAVGQSGNKLVGRLDSLHMAFSTDLKALIHATKAADVQKAAKKVGADVSKGVGDAGNTEKVLAALKAQLSHALKVHDAPTAAILKAQIAHVEHVLPDRKYAAAQYAAVTKILADGKITATESKQLHTIMAQVKDHGLPAVTRGIQQKIDQAKATEKAALAAVKGAVGAVKAATDRSTQATKDQDLSVTIPVSVTTTVSNRDIVKTSTQFSKIGRSYAT